MPAECICNTGFGMNLSCPVHSRPSQSLSSGAPLDGIVCEFCGHSEEMHDDATLSCNAEGCEACKAGPVREKSVLQFATYLSQNYDEVQREHIVEIAEEFLAASPSSLGSPPMTVYEMLDYLRGEGIERIYKNSKGFWLHPKDGDGKIIYDSYRSAGPYVRLEEAIHVGARS